jgi:predicted RNA-binding Zn-ribbon protein involved in translation (DUF1610 family)
MKTLSICFMFFVVFSFAGSGILEKGSKFYCPKCDTLLATVTYDICPGDPMTSNNLSTVWVGGQCMDCPKCNKHIGSWIFSDINNWVKPKKGKDDGFN